MTVRRTGRHPRTCPLLLAMFLLSLSVQWVTAASEYDPYKILGVSRSASQPEIKRAYKNLAREWWVTDTRLPTQAIIPVLLAAYIWHMHWCPFTINPSLRKLFSKPVWTRQRFMMYVMYGFLGTQIRTRTLMLRTCSSRFLSLMRWVRRHHNNIMIMYFFAAADTSDRHHVSLSGWWPLLTWVFFLLFHTDFV